MKSQSSKRNLFVVLGIGYVFIVIAIGIDSLSTSIGDWGAWLSGTLTPGLIVVGFMAFYVSDEARREQSEAQARMAEITERATVMAHISDFHTHLSYKASCALWNQRLSEPQHKEKMVAGHGGFDYLWLVLSQIEQGSKSQEMTAWLQRLQASRLTPEFKKDVLEVISIARYARVEFMLDQRVQDLPSLFEHFGI